MAAKGIEQQEKDLPLFFLACGLQKWIPSCERFLIFASVMHCTHLAYVYPQILHLVLKSSSSNIPKGVMLQQLRCVTLLSFPQSIESLEAH
jgi:hypothetical protein